MILLPDSLELDLSFAPASEFGAGGPKFRLLFGETVEPARDPPRRRASVVRVCHAVHHALMHEAASSEAAFGRRSTGSVRFAIMAFISHAEPRARRLLRPGLSTSCPTTSWKPFDGALVQSLDRAELRGALRNAVTALLAVSAEAQDLAEKVGSHLREIGLDPSLIYRLKGS